MDWCLNDGFRGGKYELRMRAATEKVEILRAKMGDAVPDFRDTAKTISVTSNPAGAIFVYTKWSPVDNEWNHEVPILFSR
jgi:hypothetical protein